MSDLSKLCADYLRTSYTSQTTGKLKASHARELVAAFFGYKSHAALIAEKAYPLEKLDEAVILVPDIPLIEQRRSRLSGLPDDVPESRTLADMLSTYLQEEGHFGGNVWLYDSLETYVTDVLIHDCDGMLSDQLSGVMAETNAEFFMPYFDEAEIEDSGDELVVITSGKYEGTPLDDKPFCGDTIDTTVHVTLPRIAGKRGFLDFDFTSGGSVNNDWVDPELKYGVPNTRPKEQFLEMTGGFRFGETQEQFQNRQTEIHVIRNRIAQGKTNAKDIDRLSHLLGTDQDDEFGDVF
ncbi:MAG: hypothetical protein KUF77_09745 [Candidatus Thiodiazotropha sp. (ex Lucina aurantia)]|nr:hypothetical protein [Candidatus Thiodiazotropha taylori]MBV2097835.1 hypothetical protein [Candidatus Thiodiazotropha sp. (ex Codakia orbicularis)]MBV2103292.1 hypothetical protein [Candidatus Thiodiazotropha sp. (ex Lucina aurantia)]MBV2116345.1 hypothetical protein [Candidatus Thiodiazotropha sp. (ex Lucina aurantia)]